MALMSIICMVTLTVVQSQLVPPTFSTFPTCDSDSNCGYGTFTCAYYRAGRCDITCTGYNACVESIFYCPQQPDYSCSVNISDMGSASGTQIHAAQMVGGTLDINIHATSSIVSSTFARGIIQCPIAGICNINMNGITAEGLYNGVINATQSTKLSITIQSGELSLTGATIYCPDNGPNGDPTCVISATQSYRLTAWEGATIYAVEGLASDLSISCAYSLGCGAITLYCGGTIYKYSCALDATNNYKLCSDISHICNSWLYPTPSPTSLTQPPTTTPTPAPIFSDDAVYIDSNGNDGSRCDALSPCNTIDYAYDCITGATCDYRSTGTIHIAQGHFSFYGHHWTESGDASSLVFKGDGSARTSVHINALQSEALVWFGCNSDQCWIGLDGFTLHSDRTPKDGHDVILRVRAGTVYVRDVVFDGTKFESGSYFEFSGGTIIFEHCVFTHLNSNFVFDNGAIGLFQDCSFVDNNITQTDDYTATVPLITVASASIVTFSGCVFDSNYVQRSWVTVATESHVIFNRTGIMNNYGRKGSSTPTSLIVAEGSNCLIQIIDSRLSFNMYLSALIDLSRNFNELWMDNVTFNENTFNEYDVNSYYENSFNIIEIRNSLFLNGYVAASSVAGYPLSSIAISDTVWDQYTVSSKEFYVLSCSTIQNEVVWSGIEMRNSSAVGGIYLDSYAYDESLTLSVVLSDSVFYNLSTLEFEGDGGLIAVDAAAFEFTNNRVSYVEQNIISIHSMDTRVTFQNNIFAHNTGDYILDIVTVLTPDTAIHFDTNVFIANEGGIFDLTVNDSSTHASYLYIHDVVIRDYFNPRIPLFAITSDQGATCASEGIEWNDDMATFSRINITNNHNTRIISTICIQIHMDTVNIVNNTMAGSKPLFLFQDYSSDATVLSNFIASDNEGIMIGVHAGITIRDHNVTNQSGVYLYNRQYASAYYVDIVVQNLYIMHSKSGFVPGGLLYITGNYKQINVNRIQLDGVYLLNNTGSLITIKATNFEAGMSDTCPGDITNATIRFMNCRMEHNRITQDHAYLIGVQGARAWFNDDVYISNNDCGSSFDASCLLLLDGWYTLQNVYYMGNEVNDDNVIRFGHGPHVTAYYNAQLCLHSSTTNAIEVETYLDYWNIDTPPKYGEKIYFYPCETAATSDIIRHTFLHDIGIDGQHLNYKTDGAHILKNTVCNETDCEVSCSGSVACFGSKLFCNSGICNVNCSAQYSCANIEIYSHSPNASVSVICDGSSACSSAFIEIYHASQFRLICGESSSCLDSVVLISSINEWQPTSEIYCHEYESCDSMTVKTTNTDITVHMYQYSSDVSIETPTGYISDPDTKEENLVCGDPQQYIVWDSDLYHSSVEAALAQHYPSSQGGQLQLPCGAESITFYCSNFTLFPDTIESCLMGSEPVENKNYDLFHCYPLFVTALMNTYCDGTCPNSPTSAPTNAPTFSPTQITVSPTNAPTVSPTIMPSNAPTGAPTANPTLAPSNSPIPPPTIAPTAPPTSAPSSAPSIAPSLSPSMAPTTAPSPAPTRVPTMEAGYDSFIPITFVLHRLTNQIKSDIADYANTSALSHLQQIIERGYFDDIFLLYQQFAVYVDKINGVKLEELERTSWYKWGKTRDPLRLESHIDCSKDLCVFITTYDMKTHDEDEVDLVSVNADAVTLSDRCNAIPYFQLSVQCNLRQYFNWNELGFTVDAAETINSDMIECYDCSEESFDYLLTGIFGFLGLMALLSALAFLYNNQMFCTLPGFSPVDDARWMALMIFGIQAWDFISDVNLALEIWDDLNGNGIPDEMEENAQDITLSNANIFIIISGSGATLFVLIPYIVNIIIAANIKKMISQNDAAKAYFQYYAAVFVAFVVLSGGAYPALAVVSSEIFGAAVFTSGLTAFELRRLSKIKLFGTLILENLPQIGCQILYSWTIGNFTPNTQLAFCASLLSVTASTLSYYIERNAADTTAISYYLSFECKQRGTASRSLVGGMEDELSPYDAIDDAELETIRPIKAYNKSGGELVPDHTPNTPGTSHHKHKLGITDTEKDNLWRNKGLKWKLSSSIAEVFGVSENNIEIGYVQITKYGIILHLIHYVYSTDLEALERELNEEQIKMSIGPSYYTEHCLYASFTKEIDEIFTNHFSIETNDFRVKYHKRYPVKKRQSQRNAEEDEAAPARALEKKKSSIVHGMAMHLKKMQTLNNPFDVEYGAIRNIEMMSINKDQPNQIKRKLDEIVAKSQFSSNAEEYQFLAQWMRERNMNDRNVNDDIEGHEMDDDEDDSNIIAGVNTLQLRLQSTEL